MTTDTHPKPDPAQLWRKTALVQASQWFKGGDHHAVMDYHQAWDLGYRNRDPEAAGLATSRNEYVGKGLIQTLEGWHEVTPGDWIAGPGARGEFWPIKPDVFAATYERSSSIPAGDVGKVEALAEEQIIAIAQNIREPGNEVAESWGVCFGYDKDAKGEHTVPRVPAIAVKFARAIEAAALASLRGAALLPQMTTDILQTDAYAEGRRDEQEELASVLPGTTYMDPPDGGAPTILEQLQRQAKDAARYLWLRNHAAYVGVNPHAKTCLWVLRGIYEVPGRGFDEAVDAAIAKTTPPGLEGDSQKDVNHG